MKSAYLYILLYILTLTQEIAASVQDSMRIRPRSLFFSINTQQGHMLKFHDTEIIQNYYVGFELRVGIQADDFDRNPFDISFRYPRYGIGYYMGNMNGIILGNDEQTGFGKPAALFAFFSSPIVRWKWLSLNYDISLGLSYNFNAYDPDQRPYNILIGSKNNAYIGLGLDGQIMLPKYFTLGIGVNFQHFSNGSYQKPNKGMNLVSSTFSFQINTYKNRDKGYSRFPLEDYHPTWEWYLFWGSGVRMLDTDFDINLPRQGKRWYCTAISSAALVQTSHRRKFGIGLDLFYFDWGRYVLNYRASEEDRQVDTKIRDNMSLGGYLAHEVGYKKLWLITHLGFYLTDRVGDDPKSLWLYERVGVKYHITDRLFIGLAIKAHYTKADYTEWTVGYSIVKNKKLKI